MTILYGTYAGETLTGTGDAETIFGLQGADTIDGLGGNDVIVGGTGNDSLTGGAGRDTFGYDARNWDSDTINDFVVGTDKLDLSAIGVSDIASIANYVSQVGSDTVITTTYYGSTETITLKNVTASALLASPASFVLNTDTLPAVIDGTYYIDVLFGGAGNDRMYGYESNDELNGGAGNDILVGGAGDDTLRGGAGKDTFRYLTRNFGNDIITDFTVGQDKLDLRAIGVADLATLSNYVSQSGSDTVITTSYYGSGEKITLKGVSSASLLGSANNFVFNADTSPLYTDGTGSADVIFGGAGSDTLLGGYGNDDVNGGGGNDLLAGGFGDDTLRGGAGKDVFTFDVRNYGSDTIVDFTAGQDKIDLRGLGVTDLTSLSYYASQVGSDTVITTTYSGTTEKITVRNVSALSLLSTANNFIFSTANTARNVIGTYSSDTLFGGTGADRINGNEGNDELNGANGNDLLIGGTGDDVLRGGAGKDTFVFDNRQFGNDTIGDFVVGTDKLDLRGLGISEVSTLGNYASQVGSDTVLTFYYYGSTEKITLRNVSAVSLLSSANNFVLYSDIAPRTVTGTYSTDTLFGGKGWDRLYGYDGNDDLSGGAGNDVLVGGNGNDSLRGGDGLDTFRFEARYFGTDTISDFTLGTDKLDLRGLGVTDTATLGNYIAQVGTDAVITTYWYGTAEKIILQNVSASALLANANNFLFNNSKVGESIDGTASYDDTLFGGLGSDYINGYGGNDQLNGSVGDDVLIGGSGNDMLRGGVGADRFVFANDSGTDSILDFNHVQKDKIDLRRIDGDPDFGHQPLVAVSSFTAPGQYNIVSHDGIWTIHINLDTNYTTDEVVINVTADSAITAADLLL